MKLTPEELLERFEKLQKFAIWLSEFDGDAREELYFRSEEHLIAQSVELEESGYLHSPGEC